MELGELLPTLRGTVHISSFGKNLYQGPAEGLKNYNFLESKIIRIYHKDSIEIEIEDIEETRKYLINKILDTGILDEYIRYYSPKSGITKDDLMTTMKLLLSKIRGEP